MNWLTNWPGMVVGLLAATGLLIILRSIPPARRSTLADRIAPYVSHDVAHGNSGARRFTAGAASQNRFGIRGVVGRLTAPLLHDAIRILDRLVGGRASIHRRLVSLGSPITVEQFRAEQVVWSASGAAGGVLGTLLLAVNGQRNPLLLGGLVLGAAICGIFARDWWLTHEVSRREADILAEFPVIADMLALAVTAGEGPIGALSRVTRLAQGHLSQALDEVLADVRAGSSLQDALQHGRDRTGLEPLARFLDGIAVAIERGTPLADVLRAQAGDIRGLGKRRLMEAGGKKEILMMMPVVFLILPVVILFAFYPGLVAITTVAR